MRNITHELSIKSYIDISTMLSNNSSRLFRDNMLKLIYNPLADMIKNLRKEI